MDITVFHNQIETARLKLRKLSMNDARDMFEYTSNPDITRHLHWYPHTDISQTKVFLKKVLDQYKKSTTEFTYGLELKAEGKLIGALKINNICFHNKRGEFTSILNPAYQGKGYMGEAWQGLLDFCFNKAGLHRIQSYVTPDNIPSQKKNDKAGLTYEGRLKDYWIMKGVHKDALVYAITADAFNNRKKSPSAKKDRKCQK